MYKQVKTPYSADIQSVENLDAGVFIPFDPANTDYQTFKAQINAYADGLLDEAILEDADGNLMTPSEAKAFIQELP